MEDKDWLVLLFLAILGVLVAIFISVKIAEGRYKSCMENCIPSKVLEMVPVGHRSNTSFVFYLEDGRVIEGYYLIGDIGVGDMVCNCGYSVYKLNK